VKKPFIATVFFLTPLAFSKKPTHPIIIEGEQDKPNFSDIPLPSYNWDSDVILKSPLLDPKEPIQEALNFSDSFLNVTEDDFRLQFLEISLDSIL
jgi:hypothetical protein